MPQLSMCVGVLINECRIMNCSLFTVCYIVSISIRMYVSSGAGCTLLWERWRYSILDVTIFRTSQLGCTIFSNKMPVQKTMDHCCVSLMRNLPLSSPLYILTVWWIRNEQFKSGPGRGWSSGEDLLPDFSDDQLLPEWVCTHCLWQLRLQLDAKWETLPNELLGHWWGKNTLACTRIAV